MPSPPTCAPGGSSRTPWCPPTRRAGTTWRPGPAASSRAGQSVVPVLHRRQPRRAGPRPTHRTRHLRRPPGLAPVRHRTAASRPIHVVRDARPGAWYEQAWRDPWVLRRPRRRRLAHAHHRPQQHRSRERPRRHRPRPLRRPRDLDGRAAVEQLRPASGTWRYPRSPSSTGSRCCSSAPTPRPRRRDDSIWSPPAPPSTDRGTSPPPDLSRTHTCTRPDWCPTSTATRPSSASSTTSTEHSPANSPTRSGSATAPRPG